MNRCFLTVASVVLSLSAFAGTACKNCGISDGNAIYRCGRNISSSGIRECGGIFCSKCGACPKCGNRHDWNFCETLVDNRSQQQREKEDDPWGLRKVFSGESTENTEQKSESTSDNKKIYTLADAATILNLMKKHGYEVKLDKDFDIKWNIDGVNCYIVFDDGRKFQSSFFFICSFSIDPNYAANTIVKCNEYNRTTKFGKTYVSKKNDSVIFKLMLNLRGGVTEERLIDFFDDCKQFSGHWKKKMFGK